MYCRVCNADLSWNARFCSRCGTCVEQTIRQVELLGEFEEETVISQSRRSEKDSFSLNHSFDQISFWVYSACFFFATTIALTIVLIVSMPKSLQRSHAQTPSDQNVQNAGRPSSPAKISGKPKQLRSKRRRAARRSPLTKTRKAVQTSFNSQVEVKNRDNNLNMNLASPDSETSSPAGNQPLIKPGGIR